MEQMAAEQAAAGRWATSGPACRSRRSSVSGEAICVFALAVLLVYLVLAAQYESWLLPAGGDPGRAAGRCSGAVAAVALRGMDNNVYTQIGIVLIIALASKNAILIVEFARELRRTGRTIREAAVEAARLRFRPILMTSLRVHPGRRARWCSPTGAGAASRQALGTAVFGGMIASTVLAVFFVPVFYVVFQGLSERRATRRGRTVAPARAEA